MTSRRKTNVPAVAAGDAFDPNPAEPPHDAARDELPAPADGAAPGRVHREMAAVLAVDVVGYTALMEADEADTHARLMRLRSELLDPTVASHGGRVVKNTGDGFLGSFRTANDAARCASILQTQMLDVASRFPRERRILLRMGMNFCDTIVEQTDIYGEGVNIAARLMTYAEPGDIVMPEAVSVLVREEMQAFTLVDMGELQLRNIRRKVRAVAVRIGSAGNFVAPRLGGSIDARPSIAVLPFRTLLPNGTGRLCADGVVEEITHALSTVKELFVISRGSTLSFSGDHVDLAATGRDLGVRYLLQGSVRRAGEQLTVQTELSEAATRQIIRSDRHTGTIDDLFELQAKIAVSATTSIAPHIQEWELRRAMRKHPESLNAYDYVLQARQQLYRLDHESHARARGLLQQAITLDPDYGPAYSCLAYWHIFRVGEWLTDNPEGDAVEAARAARAAIERDERDALARAIYGHVQSFLFRDYEASLSHFERALADGPNCAEAWSMSSVTYGYLGDGDAAVERAAHGLRLSPLDAHIFYKESTLAQAHYVAGHFDAAVAWARKAQANNPAAMFNDRVLAASLSALGRTIEARAVADGLLMRTPDFRLGLYQRRCPFRGAALETWIGRLREAGLPD